MRSAPSGTPCRAGRSRRGQGFTAQCGEFVRELHERDRLTVVMVSHALNEVANYVKRIALVLEGEDLLRLPWEDMRRIRGRAISMIFQEPMTSLNPVFTIGMQLTEVVLQHDRVSHDEAVRRAIAMLTEVGIPVTAVSTNPEIRAAVLRALEDAVLAFIGNPVVALLIGLVLAVYVLLPRWTPRERVSGWLADAAASAGLILLITGAGGALGQVLRDSGVGDELASAIAFDAGVGARLAMRLGGKISPLSGDLIGPRRSFARTCPRCTP